MSTNSIWSSRAFRFCHQTGAEKGKKKSWNVALQGKMEDFTQYTGFKQERRCGQKYTSDITVTRF